MTKIEVGGYASGEQLKPNELTIPLKLTLP
jgi:hypothetical protein